MKLSDLKATAEESVSSLAADNPTYIQTGQCALYIDTFNPSCVLAMIELLEEAKELAEVLSEITASGDSNADKWLEKFEKEFLG